MTNKTKEIRHIQQMLVDQKWVEDRAVEDEINARVWCANCNYTFVDNKDGTWSHKVYPNSIAIHRTSYGVIPHPYTVQPYMQSLDAIKGLEREGFLYPVDVLTNGAGFLFGYGCPAFNNGSFVVGYKEPLPTEQAARLYAILETWIYDLEGEG